MSCRSLAWRFALLSQQDHWMMDGMVQLEGASLHWGDRTGRIPRQQSGGHCLTQRTQDAKPSKQLAEVLYGKFSSGGGHQLRHQHHCQSQVELFFFLFWAASLLSPPTAIHETDTPASASVTCNVLNAEFRNESHMRNNTITTYHICNLYYHITYAIQATRKINVFPSPDWKAV